MTATLTTAPRNTASLIFKIKRHGDCKLSAVRATARIVRTPVRPGYSTSEFVCTADSRDDITFECVGGWNTWTATIPCTTCDKRYRVYGKTINGKVNHNKPCTPKCESATGPDCECHCGGENHGGRW